MAEWKRYDPASTASSVLKWTTEDQRKEEAYIKLQKRRDELINSAAYKDSTDLETKLKESEKRAKDVKKAAEKEAKKLVKKLKEAQRKSKEV